MQGCIEGKQAKESGAGSPYAQARKNSADRCSPHTADRPHRHKAACRFRSGAGGQRYRKKDAKGGADGQGCGKGRCADSPAHCQGNSLCRKSGYCRDKGCHCRYHSGRMGGSGNYPRSLRGRTDCQFLLRHLLLRRGQRHGTDHAAGSAGNQRRLSVADRHRKGR